MKEESISNNSVTVKGDNSGVIIIGDNNTLNIVEKKYYYATSKVFKDSYLTSFETIQLPLADKRKYINDIFVNLAIIKDEKEDTNDRNKIVDRDKLIGSFEEIYKPKEPIDIKDLIIQSKKVDTVKALIYGKAGVGKTTLCHYIAFKWAKNELYKEFENIIYIPLREWSDSVSLNQFLKNKYFQEIDSNDGIVIDMNTTLFLFDGYDEVLNKDILKNRIANIKNYLLTSRPYGFIRSDFSVHEIFETIGFTERNVYQYIDNFFQDDRNRQSLKSFLKENISIKQIAYIPLMLELICFLWEKRVDGNIAISNTMTKTDLYTAIIKYTFYEYTEKNNTAYIQEKEDEIFDFLGKIAFDGLKNQSIILDNSILQLKAKDKEFLNSYILKTGFLKSDNTKSNPLLNNYEFPHLTFQEYFSALYVSTLHKDEIREIIRDYKFYPHMQMFFVFLGGLIKDKEFFLREIKSEPRDEIGYYEFLLLMNCYIEIRKIDIELFNRTLSFWIIIVMYNIKKFKYEILVNRLDGIVELLNENTINTLLKIDIDKNISSQYKIQIKQVLLKVKTNYIDIKVINKKRILPNLKNIQREVDENITPIKDFLFEKKISLGKHIDIDKTVEKFLLNIKIDDFKKIMINFINDETIYRPDIEKVIQILFIKKRNDNNFLDILIQVLKNKNIDYGIQLIMEKTLLVLKREDDYFINSLIGVIEDTKIDEWRKIIIYITLSKIKRVDNYFVNILVCYIQNDKVDAYAKSEMAKTLSFIKRDDDKYIDILVEVTKNKYISYFGIVEVMHKLVTLLNKDITIFEKIDIYFFNDFIINLSSEVLFKAYDKGYIFIDKLIENTFYNTLPLYLKNNKLCTIYENQEIQTQREVTLEEIEKVKRELGLINNTREDD